MNILVNFYSDIENSYVNLLTELNAYGENWNHVSIEKIEVMWGGLGKKSEVKSENTALENPKIRQGLVPAPQPI